MKEHHKIIRRLARRAQSLSEALSEFQIDDLPDGAQDEVLGAWGHVQEATGLLHLADQVMTDLELPLEDAEPVPASHPDEPYKFVNSGRDSR